MTEIKDNLLWTYYQGVAERLRAEVDLLNKVISHDDGMGEANESVLRNLIKRFIPSRYGVGSGIVVDHAGRSSRQCDIIIYDPLLYPSLLALGEVHLFPVDFVYGVIEVKTTLDVGKVKIALENIASVKRLDIIEGAFASWGTNGASVYQPSRPMGFVFGFNSRSKTDKSTHAVVAPKFETFVEWWLPDNPAERHLGPHVVCALDQGVARYMDVDVTPSTTFKGLACVLCDDEGRSIEVSPGESQFSYGRLRYPVREVLGRRLPIDPGKSLIYFLLLMTHTLTKRRINPDIPLHMHYLKGSLARTIEVDR